MPDGASMSIRTFLKQGGMTLPTIAKDPKRDVPNKSGRALETNVVLVETRRLHLERRVAGQITGRG